MNTTMVRRVAVLAAVPLVLAACSSGTTDGGDGGSTTDGGDGGTGTTISYWLWDANQQPAYQQCADDFHAANPDITVEVTQSGWDDYWSAVTTGFVSDTAPDVFTDHLSKYPEFVANGQLLALDDYVAADGVDVAQYSEGLADLWVAQDGKRYGLPKDWDTVAVFYNADMVADAGYTAEDLAEMTWNPEDGGTYEQIIAHLTVDANGVRGDEAGFDKNNVDVYGLGLPGSGGANGQTEWSMYTGTTGWTHTATNPWGTEYNYDDPRFQDSMAWFYSLIEKGYMPPLETTVGASMNDTFGAGKSAFNVNGSWMINAYYGYEGINVGLAPTPVGPEGRASMFNGLADSIWVGTQHPDEAAKWVEYLGSTACQDVIGAAGVVFPAIPSSAELAKTSFADRGIDVSAFMIHVEEGTTFLFPITDYAADVNAIMGPAMDAVMSGQADVTSLTEANDQVNALFN